MPMSRPSSSGGVLLATGLIAALSVALTARPALAQEPPPEAPKGPAMAKIQPGIQWLLRLDEAFALARKRGELLFVYVTRHSPPDASCQKLEKEVLQVREARRISDRCVTVRVLGGNDANRMTADFFKRYGVKTAPTLLIMNHHGHVLWGAGLRKIKPTVEGILGAIESSKALEAEFAASAKATEPAARARHVERLERRMAWDDLEPIYTQRTRDEPTAENLALLAILHRRRGNRDGERETLRRLVDEHPDRDERPYWRVRLARQPFDAASSRAEAKEAFPHILQAIRELLARVLEEEDLKSEPVVRYEYGLILAGAGPSQHEAAIEQFAAVASGFPNAPQAPSAVRARADLLWKAGRIKECRAVLVTLLETYPKSPQATRAPSSIRNCDVRIAREAKQPSKDGDSSGDD